MTRFSVRRGLWPVLLGLALGGCPAPKPVIVPPPPPPPPVVKPAPPPGDLLRLAGQTGQKGQGKVTVRVENEPLPAGKQRHGSGKVIRSFSLNEEHTLTVDADGIQHVVGKLLDIESQGETPREQRELDALSRALAEIKITFDRSPRGAVTKLEVDGASKPLDPGTARIIAGSIYGAGRGYLFPENKVEAGNDWKVRTDVPIPAGGQNSWEIDYHLEKKEGPVAIISFDGKSTGESQGAKLQGLIKGEMRFDVAKGDFVTQTVDSDTISERAESGVGAKLHVHVEWTLSGGDAATADRAPQAPAASAP